jgi:peroxiredoxin
MSRRTWLAVRVLVAALIVGAGVEWAESATPQRAPSFHVRTLDGRALDSQKLLVKGPVVLDFWATWCRPCERSLPALQELHARYSAQGVTVLAVSIDGPRNWTRVRPFVTSHGLTLPVVIDEDGSLAKRYRVASVPSTIVIAPDGRVVRFHSGYVPGDEQALEAAVREALGQAADSAS